MRLQKRGYATTKKGLCDYKKGVMRLQKRGATSMKRLQKRGYATTRQLFCSRVDNFVYI